MQLIFFVYLQRVFRSFLPVHKREVTRKRPKFFQVYKNLPFIFAPDIIRTVR